MPAFPLVAFLLLLASSAFALGVPDANVLPILPSDACTQIQGVISDASSVYFPTDLLGNYAADIAHWASSSTELSACSVEPGTAEDVAAILKVIATTRSPFAVKGGGHTANPGFSSTTGVHIAMTRFSEVVYDAGSETVRVGAGLIWDDVYASLEPFGVNVVGGRVSGVGVAGFTLGGGYSWKTNQYGLTVDTITAVQLVKPTGEVVSVTNDSDPELFFALKGGGNNFGIVTEFTLKTFPQTKIWGGLITYTADQIPAMNAAVAAFSANVTDPKAGIIPTYNTLLAQPGISHIMFYDAPTPPPGIFDEFLGIPHLTRDVGTRRFLDFVRASPANVTAGTRGAFHTVSLKSYTPTVIKAIANESQFWGAALTLAGATLISYDIEPFLADLYTHSVLPKAFPPTSAGPGHVPLNLYFAWTPALATSDRIMHDALRASAAQITQIALLDGQVGVDAAGLYPNYALKGTPLTRIYGEANLARMRKVKKTVDAGGCDGVGGLLPRAMPAFRSTLVLLAFSLAPTLAGATSSKKPSPAAVCAQIQGAVSAQTSVFFPTDVGGNYTADLEHWFPSSSQASACSVEPGSAKDVSTLVKILGKTRTPFAVKGGGHASNPGFSSTPGVHISMRRFNSVRYDEKSATAKVGAGLIWDEVYAALAPHGVNVVGGRVPGVGVAGFSLGGGYSWLTNQHGLTVDNLVAFDLVKPCGEAVVVTQKSDPDLFFALKGGGNNFGIVTAFTLKTYTQGQVWGGLVVYTVPNIDAVAAATTKFSTTVTDPKAAILPSFVSLAGVPVISHIMFYDGPTPPAGIFDDFLAIESVQSDAKTRSFLDFISATPTDVGGARGAFHSISLLQYTSTMMAAIVNETNFWGTLLAPSGVTFLSYDVEPFLPSIYTHGLPSAFPAARSEPAYLPLNLYWAWTTPETDELMYDAMRTSVARLTQLAIAEGQVGVDTAVVYPNYALFDTPLERIYGGNLGRLRGIKRRVDPEGVMGLAGGFKL
ncbi:FAD-binding PCMH-type domain-containing protein [Mycena kentingensis (nom. inval.)]|nr:FAD-binding PCMH-type domain-containing protein [Mycena kentingensis (nom. inval.)]